MPLYSAASSCVCAGLKRSPAARASAVRRLSEVEETAEGPPNAAPSTQQPTRASTGNKVAFSVDQPAEPQDEHEKNLFAYSMLVRG